VGYKSFVSVHNLKVLFAFLAFLFIFFILVIIVNRNEVYPTKLEQNLMDDFFQIKEISKEKDILYVQNLVIDRIAHANTGNDEINIIKTMQLKKGLCFNRSLLLQKYFVSKGFKIRPIFFFWGVDKTTFLDFFKPSTQSHNMFELYFNDKWWLINTNDKMDALENVNQFIYRKALPFDVKFVRYLNDRRGVFIYPKFLPDIYFF